MWLTSIPNLMVCLPRDQVTVSASWPRLSSGNAGRCRNVGTPNVKPLVIETEGGSPSGFVKGTPGTEELTRLLSSYGVGGWVNSNSKSRPYWNRTSFVRLVVMEESSLATPQVSFTKSLPKLAIPRVTAACV